MKNGSLSLNQLNRSRSQRTPAIIRHLSSRVRDPARYRLYASGQPEQAGSVSLNYNQSQITSVSYNAARGSEAAQLLPPPSPSVASVEPVVPLESSPTKKPPPPQAYQPAMGMGMAPPRPAQLPPASAAYRPGHGPAGGLASPPPAESPSPASPTGSNALYFNTPPHAPPQMGLPPGHVKRESSGYVPKMTGI